MKLALQKIELRQASLRGISEESTLILINYFSQSETRIGEPGKSAQKRLNSVKPSNDHLPGPSLGMLPDKTVCCLQDNAPWGRILEPTKRKPITGPKPCISQSRCALSSGLDLIPGKPEGGTHAHNYLLHSSRPQDNLSITLPTFQNQRGD